ncbi:hypothetical protein BIV59_10945 [Bacillus sp. MUM 13]|nr:hypothetical protein BIV59_10945 [Bacillus sp. MUM 13]
MATITDMADTIQAMATIMDMADTIRAMATIMDTADTIRATVSITAMALIIRIDNPLSIPSHVVDLQITNKSIQGTAASASPAMHKKLKLPLLFILYISDYI